MQRRIFDRVPSLYALTVGASARDQAVLHNVFHGCGWKLARAGNWREARAILAGNAAHVVISTRTFPEGGWREMLDYLRELSQPPLLIVTCRLADESLWAEVLNMGGYDVLAEPLDAEEVTRVLSAARRHFAHEQERRETRPLVLSAAL